MKLFPKVSSVFMFFVLCILILSVSPKSEAQRRTRGSVSNDSSRVTYDLSASAGNYNGKSYNEINLGLNWFMDSWLNWRNSLFTRFGSEIESVSGLDSSLRLQGSLQSEEGTFGISGFLGPGVRLASANSNAVFGEAGLGFKLAGINLGVGVKSLYYLSERKDSLDRTLPREDTQVFILLSGSGTL